MAMPEMITNRTRADVEQVKRLEQTGWDKLTDAERLEWLVGLKGAYKPSDLERVQAAVNYVSQRLQAAGYGKTLREVPETWEIGQKPTRAELTNYLANIQIIRRALAHYPTTPETPRLGTFDWQGANDIEKILLDVDELIGKLLQGLHPYSGEIFCGEL